MEEPINEYRKALSVYLDLSKKETRIKVQVQVARQHLLRCKEEIRAKENELLELTTQLA